MKKRAVRQIQNSPCINAVTDHLMIRSAHQRENQIPASGDNTIMITEKINDSIEIKVALCSDGNISCRIVFVLTWRASSPSAAAKPPAVISRYIPEYSASTPQSASETVITTMLRYRSSLYLSIVFAPRMPPSCMKNSPKPSM